MMVLVTGGASSGKSACAEAVCAALGGSLVYVATMRPLGGEGARRVAKHRAQRAGKGYATVEWYGDLSELARTGRVDGATLLLECLGNAVANDLFGDGGPRRGVAAGVAALNRRGAHVVAVGNEVGCDGREYPHDTLRYLEELGRVSCEVAAGSDVVVECVAGTPAVLKRPACGMPDALARVLSRKAGEPA